MTRQCTPGRKCAARSEHGSVNIRGRALGDVGKLLAVRGVDRRKRRGSGDKGAVDEMAESMLVARQPREGWLGCLRRRAPGHALEHFSDSCHVVAMEAAIADS